jgi:hypothetical protein
MNRKKKSMLEMRVYKLNQMENLKNHFDHEFFHAFKSLPQTLLKRIWNIDEINETIQLKTDEEDVFVIPWIVNDVVYAYFAFKEENSKSFSQVKYFGFEGKNLPDQSIEILSLFRTQAELPKDYNLKRDFLYGICGDLLRDKGYKAIHATCTEKILPIYIRWGVSVLGENEIEGFRRFHIVYQNLNELV